MNKATAWLSRIAPVFGAGWGAGVTYLKSSQEDATSNGNTDLIVVVDLSFATCGNAVYLFENQNQNRRCVQVLLNPIGSEGKER